MTWVKRRVSVPTPQPSSYLVVKEMNDMLRLAFQFVIRVSKSQSYGLNRSRLQLWNAILPRMGHIILVSYWCTILEHIDTAIRYWIVYQHCNRILLVEGLVLRWRTLDLVVDFEVVITRVISKLTAYNVGGYNSSNDFEAVSLEIRAIPLMILWLQLPLHLGVCNVLEDKNGEGNSDCLQLCVRWLQIKMVTMLTGV